MRMMAPRDQRAGCVLRIVATRASVNFSDGSDGIFLIVSGDCDKSVNFQHRRPFLEVFPDEFPSNSRRPSRYSVGDILEISSRCPLVISHT